MFKLLAKKRSRNSCVFGSLHIHYFILIFSSQKTLAYVYTHGMKLLHQLKSETQLNLAEIKTNVDVFQKHPQQLRSGL